MYVCCVQETDRQTDPRHTHVSIVFTSGSTYPRLVSYPIAWALGMVRRYRKPVFGGPWISPTVQTMKLQLRENERAEPDPQSGCPVPSSPAPFP